MPMGWRMHLPGDFNRRVEDGSLVLWRPELTLWINVWNNDLKASTDELLERLRAQADPARGNEQLDRSDALIRLSYELADEDAEDAEDAAAQYVSINADVIAAAGYVQVSAYYDSPAARTLAYEIIGSVSRGAA